MEKIAILSEKCISCGNCVAVCPAHIMSMRGDVVELSNIESCIVCGHCVGACPTESVVHSSFPSEKIHKIDYSLLPTAQQLMLLCKVRRSNRAFSKEPVPEHYLEQILEAAHRAPTASNLQQVEFTLITDPEKVQYIIDYTIEVFADVMKKLTNPLLKPVLKMIMPSAYKYVPMFKRLVEEQGAGSDLILRNATAVIFIHTPSGNRFGGMDANLAYQNGSLMAEALGVSQFYTGFVCTAIKQDRDKKLAEKLGIKGKIHAGMALGMPQFRFPNYIDKKDIVVSTHQ